MAARKATQGMGVVEIGWFFLPALSCSGYFQKRLIRFTRPEYPGIIPVENPILPGSETGLNLVIMCVVGKVAAMLWLASKN
jgi:hypothetical protein